MLDTSKDVLLIVIAASVGLFTLFVCWGMFYLISIFRNFSKMTLSIREKMEIVDKILKLIHDKLEKSSNHMALVADSVIKLVGFVMEKQGEKKSSTGRKRSRKK